MSAVLGRPHPSHVTQGAEGTARAAVDSAAQRLAGPVGAGPEPASGRIAVSLLGGLEVRGGGIRVGPRGLGGTKPRHVLLALLLHRGAPLAKDRLVDLLWDGRPPTGSMATLETYVCLLRKKLQPLHSPGTGPITTVAGGYAIDMARVDLDVDRYDRLLGTALHPEVTAVAALPMLREAQSLVRAPLLPEEPDDGWLADARRAHTHRRHRGLVEAAAKVAGLPDGDAAHWAAAALECDPLDESAWLALLRSHEASGQHADGVRAYERCRRLYAAELGCAPGAGLQEAYVRLLRGAHEDDGELSLLFDAVVRLHAASRAGRSTTHSLSRAEVPCGPGTTARDFLVLHRLLHGAGRRQPLIGTIGA